MHHSTYTTACARAGVVYLLCKKDTTVGERNVYNKIHNIRATLKVMVYFFFHFSLSCNQIIQSTDITTPICFDASSAHVPSFT